MIARVKREPAVVIGILAGAVLAAIQYLGGHDLVGANVVDAITKALDPTSGWAIPIVVGIITRFFVSPATSSGT